MLTYLSRVPTQGANFRAAVAHLTDGIVKRSETLGCKVERESVCARPLVQYLACVDRVLQAIAAKDLQSLPNVPVLQTVTNFISSATNPIALSKMPDGYMPWF